MDLETKVKVRIQAFMLAKAEFTAHDITKDLRQLNPGLNIPHAEGVREIVHGLFESGQMPGYSREPDYLLGITPAPWRYYFDGVMVRAQTGSVIPSKIIIEPNRPTCCNQSMHKKGFGLYQVQRYRCLVCGKQQNEFSGSVFHNRKHRPAIILDAFWCLVNGKTGAYTANAVGVDPGTISTWRRVARETWPTTSRIISELDKRQQALDKLKASL